MVFVLTCAQQIKNHSHFKLFIFLYLFLTKSSVLYLNNVLMIDVCVKQAKMFLVVFFFFRVLTMPQFFFRLYLN